MLKRLQHSKRYREIMNAFVKNGFSHLLFRIGLTNRKHKQVDTEGNMNFQDIGIKLRHILQSLGPTFIKLGQIAGSRRDLVPKEIAQELEKLQDEVEPFPYEAVKEVFMEEIGATPDEIFTSFQQEPVATASIGQVHIAELPTGEKVAIKIQRPEIEKNVYIDLEILKDIANIMDEKITWARAYHLKDMIEEFSESLHNELNYYTEGRNGERIGAQFHDDPVIHIPEVYWDYTTRRILTMECVEGIKVSHIEKIEEAELDKKLIAERIADAMFEQVLDYGFFHGDPHPGNIFILPNNEVSFIDFGMVGELSDELKINFAALLLNVKEQNAKKMVKTFYKMELMDNVTDTTDLHRDLDKLLRKYYDVSIKELNLGGIILEIFNIAYRHHVDIPKDISIIGKAILTMEEIIKMLDPDFSIMQAVEPYGEKIFKQRYHPKRLLEESITEFTENMEFLKNIPKDMKQISRMLQKGKLRFELNVTELQAFLKRLDRISNRLSFSIILLSFSILMCGLIVGASISGHTTMLWRLPVIEIGSVIAFLMFIFLIFTIIRSGRM